VIRHIVRASLLLIAALALQTEAVMAQPAAEAREQRAPVTILISIDGFRPDYLHRGNSPALDALAAGGRTGAMRPAFPSVTFPNHYTLVTGLYPDEHGIVANTMEDARKPGVTFKLADQPLLDDPFWWDGAEPLWVTAEKQGVRTATMFWPGSTAPIHGVRPSDWELYAKAMPSAQRIRAVIDWLRRPAATRPRFLTLYFDEVDTAGHKFGPGAPETAEAVRSVDAAIGALRDGLAELGQSANLVIVADHGMAAVSDDRFTDLDKLLPRKTYRIVVSGPETGIAPMPGKEARVAKALLGRHGHLECWAKADIPPAFHYGRNPRVPPIVCLADVGWKIGQGEAAWKSKGDHGYDPAAPDMAALFLGNGPAFPKTGTVATFDNVNVYALLARLTGVTPLANDGDPKVLTDLLGE